MIADHLAQAERHVAEGRGRIEHQRRLIAELARDGHDTRKARQILQTMMETQALHEGDRDRLRGQLASIKE